MNIYVGHTLHWEEPTTDAGRAAQALLEDIEAKAPELLVQDEEPEWTEAERRVEDGNR